MRWVQITALLAWLLVGSTGASAQTLDLPQPSGPVILSVSGNIAKGNARDAQGRAVAHFDRDMLEKLGMVTVATHTPWHQELQRFEGIPGTALLDAVGAAGTELRAWAINDYVVRIPQDDLRMHGPILALRSNGQYLAVRDKGPVFLVYPYDSAPNLRSNVYYLRSIWQLRRIEIQ